MQWLWPSVHRHHPWLVSDLNQAPFCLANV
jgi:hypothetical protein